MRVPGRVELYLDFAVMESTAGGGEITASDGVDEIEENVPVKPVLKTLCDICKKRGVEIAALKKCQTCNKSYCDNCIKVHHSKKANRQHVLSKFPVNAVQEAFHCSICKNIATSSCWECEELYCVPCSKTHSTQKATRGHKLSSHVGLSEKYMCETCNYSGSALNLCIDCDEVMCNGCFNVHTKQKATRQHRVVHASETTNHVCQSPMKDRIRALPEKSCESSSLMLHKNVAQRKSQSTHKVVDYCLTGYIQSNIDRFMTRGTSKKKLAKFYEQELKVKEDNNPAQPGKPSILEPADIDSIYLAWDPPPTCFEDCSYQIRFKETSVGAKWSFYQHSTSSCSLRLTGLKSNTEYIFQVRMICDEIEGQYSPQSDVVKTLRSAAHQLLSSMYDVQVPDIKIQLKKVPIEENRKARDTHGKTRKVVLGGKHNSYAKEKTIMLVGSSGTGKSTLVDGMINYILGVNFNDPYRLTLVDLEEEERSTKENQAFSQTQWITCYVINPIKGSRLDYRLNIIDTPGFGDTRGIERDRVVTEQIRTLFSSHGKSGIVFIDAVCFLIKAPDARLTPTQMYIFNSIMSLFGQDIKDNFCMLVTFADGKPPPVLAALKEAKLPCDDFFPFNNSGLFAENSDVQSFSQMFWDMGCKSFKRFFDNLTKMETKSLQQSKDVLQQRQLIEVTIDNLLPKLDAGLDKIEELRTEIKIIEQSQTEIDDNKDFTYIVFETQHMKIGLPEGKHVTNCLNCHVTCHYDCIYANDEDKKKCCVMAASGRCTQCTKMCFWDTHKNTPYKFKYVTVKKQKTYTEKEEKYRRAENEKMTKKKVVKRMQEELCVIEEEIMKLMEKINKCNNILKEIALRPDPLSVVEHIDLLIESEKLEKRPGFQSRIASLQNCRKRATIDKDIDRFKRSVTDTTKITTDKVNLPKESSDSEKTKGVLDYMQEIFSVPNPPDFMY